MLTLSRAHPSRSAAPWRRPRWRGLVARLARHLQAPAPEPLLRDRAERFPQHCPDCRYETPHDGFGEVGLGWYAQFCRCCRCGRQSVKIWTCW